MKDYWNEGPKGGYHRQCYQEYTDIKKCLRRNKVIAIPERIEMESLFGSPVALSFCVWLLCMAEASAKRVTGDEPQRTMGRVGTAGEVPARSCVVFLAKKSFSWHGPIFGLFKSWKRSILVAYCCKNCKL